MSKKCEVPKLSLVMLTITSIVIACTSFANYNEDGFNKVFSLFLTVTLWVSLLLGYISMFLFYKNKRICNFKGRVGIISFFSNRYAAIADACLILTVILLIVFIVINLKNSLIYSLIFGALFFTLNLHCVFNGKTFNSSIIKGREKDE